MQSYQNVLNRQPLSGSQKKSQVPTFQTSGRNYSPLNQAQELNSPKTKEVRDFEFMQAQSRSPLVNYSRIYNNSDALLQNIQNIQQENKVDKASYLDQDINRLIRRFEETQVQLQNWKQKCSFLESVAKNCQIASDSLQNREITKQEEHRRELDNLKDIIDKLNLELQESFEKIKSLEIINASYKDQNLIISQKDLKLQEFSKRIKLLSQEIQKFQMLLEDKNKSILQLNDELKASTEKLIQNELQIQHLETTLDAKINENDQLQMILKSMQRQELEFIQEKQENQQKMIFMENENKELQELLERCTKETENMRKKIDYVHLVYEKQHNPYHSNEQFSSENYNEQSYQVQMEKLQVLENALANYHQEVKQKTDETKHLTQKVEKLLGEGDNMHRVLKQNVQEINQLKAQKQNQQRSYEELVQKMQRDSYAQIQEEIEKSQSQLIQENCKLKESLNGQNIKNDESIERIRALETENQKLLHDLKEEKEGNENLRRSEVKSFENQIQKYKLQLQNYEDKKRRDQEELMQTSQASQTKIKSLEEKLKEEQKWKAKYKKFKNEIFALRQQYDVLKESIITEIQTKYNADCQIYENSILKVSKKYDSQPQKDQPQKSQDRSGLGKILDENLQHSIQYDQAQTLQENNKEYSQILEQNDPLEEPVEQEEE